jgi:AraC family transcriptional regulator
MDMQTNLDDICRSRALGLTVPQSTHASLMADSGDWTGELRIGAGITLFRGRASGREFQAYGTMQVAVSLGGELRVHDRFGLATFASGFIIPSHSPHRIEAADDSHVMLAFMKPESLIGHRLMQRFKCVPATNQPLSARAVAACMAEVDEALDLHNSIDISLQSALATLQPKDAQHSPLDTRVAQVMLHCRNGLDDEKSIEELAISLAISSRYLRKLFEREVGMSVQRFRVWMKLRVAIERIVQGENLTTAAHAANFCDSAHFSKAFRAMFGVPPSCILRMCG